MRRLQELALVAAFGLDQAARLRNVDLAAPAVCPLTPEPDARFKEARGLVLAGVSLQLTMFALSGLAFQLAFADPPGWLRILIAASVFAITLVANGWVVRLLPRPDWARFFKQTLRASRRHREHEGWRRTLWGWRHSSWEDERASAS
jgi:hypothetical protein